MKKFLKTLYIIFVAAAVLFCVWFVVSWVDIVADNNSGNPVHHEYNLFMMITKDYRETHYGN